MRVSRRPAALVPQGLALWLTLLLYGCGLPVLVRAVPLDHWTWRNPLPTGSPLYSIAYGNSRFVAVGEAGTILTSPDGLTWNPSLSGVPTAFRRVLYVGGEFVAFTTNNSTWRSPEGQNWEKVGNSLSFTLVGLAAGSGVFVGIGYGDTQTGDAALSETSTNLEAWTWTPRALPRNSSIPSLLDVTYANGRFVAVGEGFNPTAAIITSLDGIYWTTQNPGTGGTLHRVAYGDGVIVAVGGGGPPWDFASETILSSTNGTDWVQHPIQDGWVNGPGVVLNDVVYAAGRFVAVGTFGRILTSTNGSDWTLQVTTDGIDLNGVAYGDGRFVVVGGAPGDATTDPTTTLFTSTDGMSWTPGNLAVTRQDFHGLAFGEGQFVAVGDRNIFTSTNGVDWSAPVSGAYGLNGVCYGGGQFVAVGPLLATRAMIVVSPDGTNWSPVLSPAVTPLYGVTYGNGQYVAVGGVDESAIGGLAQGEILNSPDGVNWTLLSTGTTNILRAVTWGNGWYVAVGGNSNAAVATSQDGVNWSYNDFRYNQPLFGITFGNGIFVTGGMMSTNPPAWTGGGWGLGAITFAEGQFVATWGGTFPSYGVGTSADGLYFSRRLVEATVPLRAIAYGNGRFVTVGDRGAILQSAFLSPPAPAILGPIQMLATNSITQITITGSVGQAYDIQTSTDLQSWAPLTRVAISNSITLFTDGVTTNSALRFYRAIVP